MTPPIVVDDREPAGVCRAVESHADVAAVEVARLPAADIAAGGAAADTAGGGSAAGESARLGVGIERKTVSDYAGSAVGTAGTDLREQVVKMGEAYDHAYVLIEGDLAAVGAGRPGLDAAAVHGTMASYAARHDTPVVPCSDRRRLVDLAVRLIRKHTEAPGSRPLPGGTVTGYATPTTKRMFGCIEGVGRQTADALYEAFPSIEALVSATPDDLRRVEGVGEKRAEAIYEALRGERDG